MPRPVEAALNSDSSTSADLVEENKDSLLRMPVFGRGRRRFGRPGRIGKSRRILNLSNSHSD
ncbi:hypothetical protein HYS94_03265 [Candidatus Daviesbacteria bacterium]|nr:hypothetical protein [Candidatus Daviesbacteria bacterium]MBI4035325.1 hypothetical protein [Candidatus Daviesbacteria bacterium]